MTKAGYTYLGDRFIYSRNNSIGAVVVVTVSRKNRFIGLPIPEKGEYGKCSLGGCSGIVIFYTDNGVKCDICGKLYGTWKPRKRRSKTISSLISRQEKLLN